MPDRDSLERSLDEIARARSRSDALTREQRRLAGLISAGFREDFGEMDMETAGAALVLAAASLVPLTHDEIPPAVLVNLLAFAGEDLVREARARSGVSGG